MMAASAQKTRPAKVALRLLGQGNAHSGLYGPSARRIIWLKDSNQVLT